jgi:hypothetical protein
MCEDLRPTARPQHGSGPDSTDGAAQGRPTSPGAAGRGKTPGPKAGAKGVSMVASPLGRPLSRGDAAGGGGPEADDPPAFRVWDFDLAEGDRGVYVVGFPTADRPNSTYVV